MDIQAITHFVLIFPFVYLIQVAFVVYTLHLDFKKKYSMVPSGEYLHMEQTSYMAGNVRTAIIVNVDFFMRVRESYVYCFVTTTLLTLIITMVILA